MFCWSGYTLLVAGVDAVVAEATPLPLTALVAVSGVVLVAALAMSLRAVSHERGLARLGVEKHAKDRNSS
jgi:hypothetical protein